MRRLIGWMAVVAVGFLSLLLSGCTRTAPNPKGAASSEPAAAETAKAIDQATGLALQGDAAAAVKILAAIPEDRFQGDDANFRACMLRRFGSNSPDATDGMGDPWITTLATDYRAYWKRALTKPSETEEAQRELRGRISQLLKRPVNNDADFDAAEDRIKDEALSRGFHVLLGQTPPLRELMIWKKVTVEQRQVNLPEGPQSVKVTYLDDFLLRGWGSYATCERRSAGGWATDDGLFAVVPAYKSLSDETFSVRLLAHETQHFADKKAFPNLESWELEYRAKLVELSLAEASRDSTLQLLCENRTESKASPHGYADFRVVEDLTERVKITADDLCKKKTLTGQPLRDAAKAVLLDDSKKRLAKK